MVTLGINAHHHHIGVLSSTIRETASEIQPIVRLFATNGSRSNPTGGSTSFGAVGAERFAAILVRSFLLSSMSFSTGCALVVRMDVPGFLRCFRCERHIVVVRHRGV